VQARVRIVLAQRTLRYAVDSGHYNGEHLWNLNPRRAVWGHFFISPEILKADDRLRARLDVTLIDIYGRAHPLLPMGYIHGLKPSDEWYAEVSMQELDIDLEPLAFRDQQIVT
jgi:hypothetical protein